MEDYTLIGAFEFDDAVRDEICRGNFFDPEEGKEFTWWGIDTASSLIWEAEHHGYGYPKLLDEYEGKLNKLFLVTIGRRPVQIRACSAEKYNSVYDFDPPYDILKDYVFELTFEEEYQGNCIYYYDCSEITRDAGCNLAGLTYIMKNGKKTYWARSTDELYAYKAPWDDDEEWIDG